MAATTIPPRTRDRATPPWHQRVRSGMANVGRQTAQVASVARHRLRRPALVIGGLGCMDASAWHTFGLGAGLLGLGLACWVFELLDDSDEQPGGQR